MKNITVSIPDDVYRDARVTAAQRGRSVSAIVAEFLRSLSPGDDEHERLRRRREDLLARTQVRFVAGERLARDELHDRAVR